MAGEMNRQVMEPSKSKLGDLDAKYMVLIIYLGAFILGLATSGWAGWIVPLVVFIIDKENKFIAFHAVQMLLLEAISFIIAIIMAIVVAAATVGALYGAASFSAIGFSAGLGVIGAAGIISVIVSILIFVGAILALVRGYRYEIYEVIFVGKFAEKIVFKTA